MKLFYTEEEEENREDKKTVNINYNAWQFRKKQEEKKKELDKQNGKSYTQDMVNKYGWSDTQNKVATIKEGGKQVAEKGTEKLVQSAAASSAEGATGNPYIAAAKRTAEILKKGKDYVASNVQNSKAKDDENTAGNKVLLVITVGVICFFLAISALMPILTPILAIGSFEMEEITTLHNSEDDADAYYITERHTWSDASKCQQCEQSESSTCDICKGLGYVYTCTNSSCLQDYDNGFMNWELQSDYNDVCEKIKIKIPQKENSEQ